VFNSIAISDSGDHSNTNAQINKAITRLERKKNLLQEKLNEMEIDNDLLNGLLVDKEKDIYELQAKIAELTKEQSQANDQASTDMVYIKRIAELEAEMKFKEEEVHESRAKLAEIKDQKRKQLEEM
jgi:DNA repair exonuclease SbcCD ATPase subunit